MPPSGSTFAKGTTTVTCTATDAAGNTQACTFTVRIQDIEIPSVICPANIVGVTDGGQCSKSNVSYAATAADNCPGAAVVCVPPSGSTFAKGTTTVTCTATDVSGNTNACTFTILVRDTENPLAVCPANIVGVADLGLCSKSNVTYAATAADNCPGALVACVPPTGSTFAKGTTPVTCTATDASGNTHACTFTVRITDAEAPSVVCSANIVAVADGGLCSKSNVSYAATAADNWAGSRSCPPVQGGLVEAN